jgi:hypothetical protein
MSNLRRRFARGLNKTIKGVGKKFSGIPGRLKQKPKKGGLTSAVLADPTNAIAGVGLAGYGNQLTKQAKQEKLMRQGVSFSGPEYEEVIEFAMEPGVDPSIVKDLIMQAARIQQEGQTKIVISRQLFEQLQAALQNFQIQKQQVDNASVERIKTQGFNAGYDLINF